MTATDTPRRAVLYGRVSKLARADKDDTSSQRARGEGRSVDQQLDELTDLARREAVHIIGIHRDDGISASRFAGRAIREGWRDVMADIVGGRVTELWTWEISRATRDRPVWAALINTCIAQQVKITINGKVHDPTDPDDGFMLDLAAAMAVRESAATSKRIRRAVAARAGAGLPHGRIPYGYRRIYDERTRALIRQEPDPETAPIVRELARRVLAGQALYALAAELIERGVPSPDTVRARRQGDLESSWVWRPDQVRKVIVSPAAAGQRVHRGEIVVGVPAAWPALIEDADHRLLVAKLTDPRRRSWVDGSVKHLLAGLAVCGECGSPMRRVKNRGCPSYACWGGKGTGCTARKQEWVDTYVEKVIVARLGQPDVLDLFTRDDADDVQAAQRELAVLRAELADLRAAKKAGRLSLPSFLDFEPDLLSKISAAEGRATPATVPPVLTDLAGPHARARWNALTIPQRREVIRTLCVVRIHRSHQGARTFDPATVTIEWRTA